MNVDPPSPSKSDENLARQARDAANGAPSGRIEETESASWTVVVRATASGKSYINTSTTLGAGQVPCGDSMPSLSERILPELILFEPGPERQRMLQQAVHGQRTRVAAFLSVVGATGLFVLWDKLVASVPSSWSLHLMFMLYLIGFGIAIWFTRRDIRRHLRAQLAKKRRPGLHPLRLQPHR